MDPDARELLSLLLSHQVRFLVVGAHALAVHGVPRATGDLDVWVEPVEPNVDRLWRALTEFGAPLDALDVRHADFLTPEVVVQFGVPPRRIDILTSVSGLTFEEAWVDRHVQEVDGVEVPFLGRASLIRNKRASGRPKDLGDLDALR